LVRRNANLFVIRILVFYWNLNRQFGEGDQAAVWFKHPLSHQPKLKY